MLKRALHAPSAHICFPRVYAEVRASGELIETSLPNVSQSRGEKVTVTAGSLFLLQSPSWWVEQAKVIHFAR